jgi:transposase
MTYRRTHAAEFKRDAVRLARTRTSGNLSRTARELGLNASLLRKWPTTEQEQGEAAFPDPEKQNLTPERQEIRRLCKENEILCQE